MTRWQHPLAILFASLLFKAPRAAFLLPCPSGLRPPDPKKIAGVEKKFLFNP
ncbi:hypothetical protein EIO60_01959|nr:hypothetical protein [Candidatus Pantoea persica]